MRGCRNYYDKEKFMTGIGAQFASASAGNSGYLSASLNLMTADTRQGLPDSAKADFAIIKKYAAEHPDRLRVASYGAKTESSFERPAEKGGAFKPNLGM